MVNDDPNCTNNDAVVPVPTNSSGISQTGVVVDEEAEPGCTLSSNPATCPTVVPADDGKQIWAPGLPSNAYVYGATAGHTFTLSSSPVSSVPFTSATVTNVVLIGETYSVKVTDTGDGNTATTNLMVNPNGVIKWGVIPAGTFSQYPLTGTAVTIPVT